MTWKDHVRGVLIALGIAIVSIFGLSLMMSSQVIVQEDVVVNQPDSTVYNFLRDEGNLRLWISELEGIELREKSGGNYQYVGANSALHDLQIYTFDKNQSVELNFFKDGEKIAVFNLICDKVGEQSLVKISQFWYIGVNPISKLMAYNMDEQLEEKLKDDLYRLKLEIEK